MANWRDKFQNKRFTLSANGTNATATGSTSELSARSVVVPAGYLAVGDIIRVSWLASVTITVAGTQRMRARFGNNATMTSNNAIFDHGSSTATIHARNFDICITSANTATVFTISDADASGTATTTPVVVSTDFDITTDNTLYVGALLSDTTNVLTLHSLVVDIIKAD